jgi:hypothetical protein
MDDIASLLETAAATMRAELMEALPADRRYTAAMVANAMAIAARALRHPAPPPDHTADRALAAAIRAGQHDDDPALRAALRARVNARLAISDPAALETP